MFVRLLSHLKIIITTDHTVIQSFAVCYRAVLVLMRHSYKETHNQLSVSQKWQLYETKWKQLKMTLTASPRRTVFCGILLTAFFAAVVSRFWNSNMYTQETIIQSLLKQQHVHTGNNHSTTSNYKREAMCTLSRCKLAPTLPIFSCTEIFVNIQTSTLYRCTTVMS